jgi:hypothetical protein
VERSYPYWECSLFFSTPPLQMVGNCPKLGHNQFLLHPFQFVIQ